MPLLAAQIIGLVLAIIGTVLACIFILPEKKRASLNKFFHIIADIFNFKTLFIEKILKVLYVLSTLYCLMAGFFMLFSGVSYDLSYWGGESTFKSYALYGLLVMILGPIVVRVVYELLMLAILMVQNIITINKKIPAQADEDKKEAAPAPKMLYCTQCGTQYDANKGGCPNGCKND